MLSHQLHGSTLGAPVPFPAKVPLRAFWMMFLPLARYTEKIGGDENEQFQGI